MFTSLQNIDLCSEDPDPEQSEALPDLADTAHRDQPQHEPPDGAHHQHPLQGAAQRAAVQAQEPASARVSRRRNQVPSGGNLHLPHNSH